MTAPSARAPRMVSVLTENWTMTDPRDIRGIVRMAQEAEDAGFDMVMVSDHVLLGPSAGSQGRMANPRDYAMPGNQDPATAWPSNIVLLSAIAAATTRIRIGAIALIAPLRHPLTLAHDLATLDLLSEGRLVIQPTVSWHKDEYDALGVPWTRRGRILDEQLRIWEQVWARSPVSFDGEFFSFEDVYLEPKPTRPTGPAMWFGGDRVHGAIVDRLVRYGSGYHPLGRVTEEDVGHAQHARSPRPGGPWTTSSSWAGPGWTSRATTSWRPCRRRSRRSPGSRPSGSPPSSSSRRSSSTTAPTIRRSAAR